MSSELDVAPVAEPPTAKSGSADSAALPPRTTELSRPRRVLVRLPPAWPFIGTFALFPLWWALGLGVLIFNIMAVPMAVHLWRRRPVLLPPGFGIWALFLVWLVVGFLMLDLNPIGTLPGTVLSRSMAYSLRLVSYLALTVMLLYVGNMTEEELPRRRIVALLAWMFAVTVVGGLSGILRPDLEFTSPLEAVLPGGLAHNAYVQSLVHPALSQVQDVLGYSAPRPKAPFEYTNSWGNNLSLSGVWFVCLAVIGGLSRRRAVTWTVLTVVLVLAVIPAIWSLNRGMWIGVGLSVVYLAVRLAWRRRFGLVVGVLTAVVLALATIPVTPLGGVIGSRLDNPRSNEIRSSLSSQTLKVVNLSPILGFGSTRTSLGSPASLAVGKSAECPQCGNFIIGSNGQLWQLLVSTGYPGTALYLLFFLFGIWRYRRDSSAIGVAGSLGLFLALFYALLYNAVPSPLAFYLVSYGLLWRNQLDGRLPDVEAAAEPRAATMQKELREQPT